MYICSILLSFKFHFYLMHKWLREMECVLHLLCIATLASVFIFYFLSLFLPRSHSGSFFFCVCLLMSISRLAKTIFMEIYQFFFARLLLLLQRLHNNIVTNNDAMMNFHCNGTPLNERIQQQFTSTTTTTAAAANLLIILSCREFTLTRRTNWQQYQANIACHKYKD